MGARILVVRAGALGDILLLRRLLRTLRRSGTEVTLLAPSSAAAVLVDSRGGGDRDAQALIPWEGAAVARLLGSDDGAREARAAWGAFDAALCYSRNAELAQRLEALAPRVVRQDPQPSGAQHASLWLAQPLAQLGLEMDTAVPEPLRPSVAEAAQAAEIASALPAPFLAVHPGSGSSTKNWPADRFRALVERVSAHRPWLLACGPADDAVESALAHVPGAVVARDLPLPVLGALLAAAEVYVGNDSGVSHLAAAFGARTVALFGPTDARVWSPVGPHVRTIQAEDGRMESLGVADVERAWATCAGRALPSS